MARFKNLPREVGPGTCTMLGNGKSASSLCAPPTAPPGQMGGLERNLPDSSKQSPPAVSSWLMFGTSGYSPTPFIWKKKLKPPLRSLCFSSKLCWGPVCLQNRLPSEQPSFRLWLIPGELHLPRPGSCVGDERTSCMNGSRFIASLRRTWPLLEFGSVATCWEGPLLVFWSSHYVARELHFKCKSPLLTMLSLLHSWLPRQMNSTKRKGTTKGCPQGLNREKPFCPVLILDRNLSLAKRVRFVSRFTRSQLSSTSLWRN